MINLRYHVVSLVAVFLALGVGVVMGSTVIDRVTVDALEAQVDRVENSVKATQAENRRLDEQLRTVRDFADQARDRIAEGHLEGVTVLVVAVTGVDREPVDGLRQALASSEADVAGTLWFTAKMRLDNEGDARALATGLGLSPDEPDVLRRQALVRVAAVLEGGGETELLPSLLASGFVAYEGPPDETTSATSALAALPRSGMRMALVSGAGADVGDDQIALPLAQALGLSSARVVAAEAGQDSPGGRGVFVGLLRKDDVVGARISTVDNLESPMGQAAAVLALDDLAVPRTGHYGVGPGAQRLLPTDQA
ncbi:MAG TPA: copper transporter [Acidimicrobiales bacterium]|nr:copper transporter [Acidimicrobiales bacterium]